jgi:hypothetical protein
MVMAMINPDGPQESLRILDIQLGYEPIPEVQCRVHKIKPLYTL